MANISRTARDKNALCYLWLTFSLLLISTVCFGISATQKSAVYAGAVFLVLTVICAILYIGNRCSRGSSNSQSDEGCCEIYCSCCMICCPCCYTNGCFHTCMGKCYRKILCLPPKETYRHERRRSFSRRDRIRMSVANGVVMEYVDRNRNRQSTLTSATVRTSNERTVSLTKLRSLEQDIQALFQEYSFLQTDGTTANNIIHDYSRLEYENNRLTKWIEGHATPNEQDVKDMKASLKKIKRNFRLARMRLNQDVSVRADPNADITGRDQPSTVHQLMLYATDMPVPPPYQEQDPLEHSNVSTNTMPSETNTSYISGHVSIDNCIAGQTLSNIDVRNSFPTERSQQTLLPETNRRNLQNRNMTVNYFSQRNSASTRNLLDISSYLNTSMCSLAPPDDETGAPPTYEEATSTTV